MVWLWESPTEPEISGETITVSVARVGVPEQPEWGWDSKYLVEVNDLQTDVNYTAIINVYRLEDSWQGLDWWWDINWKGGYDEDANGYNNQSENPFHLDRGCYHIDADLYERDALYSNEDNATVLASVGLDFAVGTGTCAEGVYFEEVVYPGDYNEGGGLPGFGIILSITASLGAALIVARRE
jgi:hypothetical protein